jgi:hypothetical protein
MLARDLAAYDVVNVGAAGTLVVRKPVSRTKFLAELRRKLPFEAAVSFCQARDLIRSEMENPFGAEPSGGTFGLGFAYIIAKKAPMSYSPMLIAHIIAGTLGLLSGTAAMSFRKGSPRHVLAGKIFVASMLTMAVLAVYLAIVRHQPNNIGGGILTFYLIGTGWLTAKRRDGVTSRFDWVVLLIPLALGTLTWMNGLKVVRSGASSQDGVPVGMTFFMGSVMLLAGAGDVRMLLRGGVLGAKRITRHLWRMCFGLFIAAGSFFLGPSNRPLRLLSTVGIGQHLSPALFGTTLYLTLTVLPLIMLIFWLVRLRFANAYQGSIQLASASPDLTR